MNDKEIIPDQTPITSMLEGASLFRNKVLIAFPGTLTEGVFSKSVVYVCAHSPAGAMGLVINRPMPQVLFGELLEQLNLEPTTIAPVPLVHFGGPVEMTRGLVLHSTDFSRTDTVHIDGCVGITGTLDILKAMAEGAGPQHSIFALGYVGWGPGQLEDEVKENLWLTAPADPDLLFSTALNRKWGRALRRLGIDPAALSSQTGVA